MLVAQLYLGRASTIGFFNLIRVNRLVMKEAANIGALNQIHGDFSICLKQEAAIGNRNRINRGPYLGDRYPSSLMLGVMAKITADHYVNLICPVSFGSHSVLAGSGSQVWTHGYRHDAVGRGRQEIKRPVKIGDNVYIASMSCVGPGVTLGNAITIGAHSSVARSLAEPGLYVSVALRHISREESPQSEPVKRC